VYSNVIGMTHSIQQRCIVVRIMHQEETHVDTLGVSAQLPIKFCLICIE
jgi:hypothetical protein